jgi:thiol:disulfide interchange protein DsbD
MALPLLGADLTHQPLVALPVIFAAGVLTSLTPCVYPMIPIVASVVGGGAGTRPSRRRVVGLTAAYCIAMAGVYAALGLFAGLTGSLFGAISSSPWLYLLMANALLLFALMMLDVIRVPLPERLLTQAATLESRGRYGGAAAMGATSGLVAAPCGAPVFATILTWIGTTQNAALGGLYLFVFSLGMSALLVGVGLFAGLAPRLPRAGVWMVWVKRGFAALMFGVAQYYLIEAGKLFS